MVFEEVSAQGAVSWAAPGVSSGFHLHPNVALINHSTIKKKFQRKSKSSVEAGPPLSPCRINTKSKHQKLRVTMSACLIPKGG